MKNTLKPALTLSALLLAIMGLQGCDSSVKVNEENCTNLQTEAIQSQFKSESQWEEFKNQCKHEKLGRYKFLDYQDHQVNKENCDKLYSKDNSFSEEYKKNFSNDLGWRRFADSCHSLDKTKPSPYKSWTPFEPDRPNATISVQPEINKENCSKIYREDGSISKEYKEQFKSDSTWKMFADVCKANQL